MREVLRLLETAERKQMIESKQRERRYRYFFVSMETLMTLLAGWRTRETICLPIVKGLPDGYSIEGVHHDFSRDGFILRFYHESFPVLNPGCEPMIETWDSEAVVIRTENPVGGFESRLPDESPELLKWALHRNLDTAPNKRGWEFLGAP